jgi:hypothetical protein
MAPIPSCGFANGTISAISHYRGENIDHVVLLAKRMKAVLLKSGVD